MNLEDLTALERIDYELSLIEWGDSSRDGQAGCVSCGRIRTDWAGMENRHSYGCSIRNIRDQLLRLEAKDES